MTKKSNAPLRNINLPFEMCLKPNQNGNNSQRVIECYSDRNHYFAKTEGSTEGWNDTLSLRRYANTPTEFGSWTRPKSIKLEEKLIIDNEECSEDRTNNGDLTMNVNEHENLAISVIQSKPNKKAPNFDKYLTPWALYKTNTIRDLAPDEKLSKLREKFINNKYSVIHKHSRREIFSSDTKAHDTLSHGFHCKSANDLKPSSRCRSLLCDCSYTSTYLRRHKASKKDLRDLNIVNAALRRKIDEEKKKREETDKKLRIMKTEKERVEFEVKRLNHYNNELNTKLTINNRADEIMAIVGELSGMMLSSQRSANLTENQRSLVKNLFGDVATQGYKERIKVLENNLKNKNKEWVNLKEEMKLIMLHYLEDIQKFDSKTLLNNVTEEKSEQDLILGKDSLKKWTSECDSTNRNYFYNRKIDILNRLNEINSEKSTKQESMTTKSKFKVRRNDLAEDFDTFILEMGELENISSRAIIDKAHTKSNIFDLTDNSELFAWSKSFNGEKKKFKTTKKKRSSNLQVA